MQCDAEISVGVKFQDEGTSCIRLGLVMPIARCRFHLLLSTSPVPYFSNQHTFTPFPLTTNPSFLSRKAFTVARQKLPLTPNHWLSLG